MSEVWLIELGDCVQKYFLRHVRFLAFPPLDVTLAVLQPSFEVCKKKGGICCMICKGLVNVLFTFFIEQIVKQILALVF